MNGLLVGGILFQYSLGSGQVIIDGGPGPTNNISPPNIVSVVNPAGVLTLTLPSPVDLFGFGYALLSANSVANATTISLFEGATPLGSQSYLATPDPLFAGGFAGIKSTAPFDRVQITFNSVVAPAFALDNIHTETSVPEPATIVLLGGGVLAFARRAAGKKS